MIRPLIICWTSELVTTLKRSAAKAQAAIVIGLLAAEPRVGLAAVDAAANELGISRRQVYVLLGRWRAGEGVVSDLLLRRSSGGRKLGRLPAAVEAVMARGDPFAVSGPAAALGGSGLPGGRTPVPGRRAAGAGPQHAGPADRGAGSGDGRHGA